VARPALRIAGACHQAGVLEDFEVLRDRLQGHVIRRSQLSDGGVLDGQPGDDVTPGGIAERREDPGELVRHVVIL
jgi:hypothetical protein